MSVVGARPPPRAVGATARHVGIIETLQSRESELAVTIRDVAAAAAVSPTTVSHVLSNQGRIGEDTRRRVLAVASGLGYRPNVHAQQIKTHRSRSLAIQVAPFDSASTSSMLIPHSEYFLELLNGACAEADRSGYALVLTPTGVEPAAVDAFAVDGAIIIDPHGDEGLLGSRWAATHPVVTAGRAADPRGDHHVVDNDHYAAALQVLDHLADQGYRRPAAVVTDLARSYTRDLIDAYTEWTRRRGSPTRWVTTGVHRSAAEALRTVLDDADPPDALYCGSDEIALDVLHEATRLGIPVPGQLGLCSCVDTSTFTLTTPEVTGVHCHPRAIGAAAVALLVALLDDDGAAPARLVTVPTELLVRRSTIRNRPG